METARGEWTAARSTQANVAYDYGRRGVRVGIDAAVGERGRFGLSVRGLCGSAEMAQGGGKVELSGAGLHGAASVGGGVYVDAQAAMTWYDVELTLSTGTTLKDGARGTGYALAVEAGHPVALNGNLSLTPRAGLAWSRVSLKDFTDARARNSRVSVADAGSFKGRAGVNLEATVGDGMRLFGSVDAARESPEETEATVGGTELKASAVRSI